MESRRNNTFMRLFPCTSPMQRKYAVKAAHEAYRAGGSFPFQFSAAVFLGIFPRKKNWRKK